MAKPSGEVYLCKNAIINRNYTHTIDFKNPSEQRAYWGSLVKYTVLDVMYIRRSSQCIRVDYSLDDLQDVNYLFFKAKEDSKIYYCFVTSKEYYSDSTTYVYFETDVLQSYMFDYKVNQSYVLQEHCNRWDANHKPIYSRTDEGLNYGSEYTVESAYKIKAPDIDYLKTGDEKYAIVLARSHSQLVASGTASEPTQINGIPNPYCIYLLPMSTMFYYDGAAVHTVANAQLFDQYLSKSALGDFISQIILLPYLPFDHSISEVSDGNVTYKALQITSSKAYFGVTELKGANEDTKIKVIKIISTDMSELTKLLAEMSITEGLENALPTNEQWATVLANPYTTERDKRFESKLLTHPYRYNLVTDWRNTPLVIKNEYLTGDKIKVNMTSSLGFNGAFRYWVENYKKDPEGRGNSINQRLQFDLPVVSDAFQEYMLQNRNQIQANQESAIINAATNVVQSTIGGAMFGGPAGMISSGIGGAVTGALNVTAMIRQENAKQQDIKNLPDSIVGSNECAINLIDKNTYLTFYRYKICCEFEELLADTFNMSGYTVKRVKVPNLKSRVRFNYIKTVGANITGSFDQGDLTKIKEIFDNGITFWHYNAINFKPFDYSLENIERNLLTE